MTNEPFVTFYRLIKIYIYKFSKQKNKENKSEKIERKKHDMREQIKLEIMTESNPKPTDNETPAEAAQNETPAKVTQHEKQVEVDQNETPAETNGNDTPEEADETIIQGNPPISLIKLVTRNYRTE